MDQGAGDGSSHAVAVAAALDGLGYLVERVVAGEQAQEMLGRRTVALMVVAFSHNVKLARNATSVNEKGDQPDWIAMAHGLGIPLLVAVSPDDDPSVISGQLRDDDDWVIVDRGGHELAARVARQLRRRQASATVLPATVPIDTRFCALVVHDLRTPLNVIGLSLRMIEQVLPREDPEVVEDLLFIDENFRQIERMLSQLGDYARLFEPGLRHTVSEFSPRRLVEELLANRESRGGSPGLGKRSPVVLDIQKTAPEEAALDQSRARMAIDYVLTNASTAAQGDPIRLTIRGDHAPDRWLIEASIDRPPPSSVRSVLLGSESFERLCGTAAERRGMDLAIAARVSELFGGSARLDATEGRNTSVILDWPRRISAE